MRVEHGVPLRDPLRERDEMSRLAKVKGLFYLAAGVAFLLSVYLWFGGQKNEGLFVGLWVPSILSFAGLVLSGRGERP